MRVKCPSIASNSQGDIMVVFRNKLQSIMYYFKKKSTGAVAGTVFSFSDSNGITPSSDFEYTVTAVNDKGIESRIQDSGTLAAVNAKSGERKAQFFHAAREIQ